LFISFFDQLGRSNRRLALAILIGLILTVAGAVLPIGGAAVRTALTFFGGVVFALTLTSWQFSAEERVLRAATDAYWKNFSSNAVIYLSTRSPDAVFEATARSPLTPYHDAHAALKIQDHLLAEYGKKVPIVSVGDIENLDSIRAKNVILIGGPNLNHLTRELMAQVWKQWECVYFHWSSTIAELGPGAPPIGDPRDHFLQLQMVGSEMRIADEIWDLYDGGDQLVEAPGMCLRVEGVLGPGSRVLVLAGAANAYGTLAAADYALTPENLRQLTTLGSQFLVKARLNSFDLHEPELVRSVRGTA
jgi:hypothetical protein